MQSNEAHKEFHVTGTSLIEAPSQRLFWHCWEKAPTKWSFSSRCLCSLGLSVHILIHNPPRNVCKHWLLGNLLVQCKPHNGPWPVRTGFVRNAGSCISAIRPTSTSWNGIQVHAFPSSFCFSAQGSFFPSSFACPSCISRLSFHQIFLLLLPLHRQPCI